MKVNCIFDGGLGNQLFQYAFAFALKHQLRGSTLEAVNFARYEALPETRLLPETTWP